jgi:hypothetical protein
LYGCSVSSSAIMLTRAQVSGAKNKVKSVMEIPVDAI